MSRERIKKILDDAVKTKKNIAKRQGDQITISKHGVLQYCNNIMYACRRYLQLINKIEKVKRKRLSIILLFQ